MLERSVQNAERTSRTMSAAIINVEVDMRHLQRGEADNERLFCIPIHLPPHVSEALQSSSRQEVIGAMSMIAIEADRFLLDTNNNSNHTSKSSNKKPWDCVFCNLNRAVSMGGVPRLTRDENRMPKNRTMEYSIVSPHCGNTTCAMEVARQLHKYAKLEQKRRTISLLQAKGASNNGKHHQQQCYKLCANCKKVGVLDASDPLSLRKCSRCVAVWYCNERCQHEHWKVGHSIECDPPFEFI